MTAASDDQTGGDLQRPYKLAAAGLHIFPTDATKKPLTRHGLTEASTDHEQIAAWVIEHGDRIQGWGVNCGASGLVVADIDVKNGKDGLQTLLQAGLELPRTFTYRTPSGGEHHIYRHAEAHTFKSRADIPHKGHTLQGVDVRAGGGYIIWHGDETPFAETLSILPAPPAWLTIPRDTHNDATEKATRHELTEWLTNDHTRTPRPVHTIEATLTRLETQDFGHDELLRAQGAIARASGHGYQIAAYEARLRNAWLRAPWDTPERAREYADGLAGAIGKYATDDTNEIDAARILANIPRAEPPRSTAASEQPPREPPEAAEPRATATWEPVNLAPYLDGTYEPPKPALLQRDDQRMLLYPGLVHSIHGESESGKSFIAQYEAAQCLQQGQAVLYVDYESDAGQVIDRLLNLGATREQIATGLHYVRPERNPYSDEEVTPWRAILGEQYALAVIDGVTDSLGQSGASSKDNDEIAEWHRTIPKAIASRTGAAVVLIDHVPKQTEGRSRFAIGGQTKMAALDGAAYLAEVIKPLGKGLKGVVSMRVGKDRPGQIRPHCGPYRADDRTQEAARVTIDSTSDTGRITVTVAAPELGINDSEAEREAVRYTGAMEKLSRIVEAYGEPVTQRTLTSVFRAEGGKAKTASISVAVKTLTAEGFLGSRLADGGAFELYHLRPYRQSNDPKSDQFEGSGISIGGEPV